MRKVSIRAAHRQEYCVWAHVLKRCRDVNNPYYGGRGITVCERWLSFDNFLADMGARPSPQHSIDRIDTNGNYGPGNCRWATATEQSRNRRSNLWISSNGETKIMQDWSAVTAVDANTIWARIHVLGWSPEKAAVTPVKQQRSLADDEVARCVALRKEGLPLDCIAAMFGVSRWQIKRITTVA